MWNYYYRFENERQLDGWTVQSQEQDGSVRISCEAEFDRETDKILLWAKNQKHSGVHPRVLEINGNPVRNTRGFYIGSHTERQGVRIHFLPGKNKIEALIIPGSDKLENFRMQLIDIPAKTGVKEYYRGRSEPARELPPEAPEIGIEGLTPGA